MNRNVRLRLLEKAKEEFVDLSKKTLRKAKWFKVLDLLFKTIIAICGVLVAYGTDQSNTIPINFIKAFGIIITGLSAISGIFTFEKRAQSNMQVYSKCKVVIPELTEKIEILKEPNPEIIHSVEDIHEYLKDIFNELSNLSLASFTDAAYGRITNNQRTE